jgi:hypothetical protein
MRVLMSGSSGLVGTAALAALQRGGHEVAPLVRRAPRPGTAEIGWDPEGGAESGLDPARLEGFDAVVHLAGENIASARWTAAHKARIAGSRVGGTTALCTALAALARPPRVLVAASAVGYYGNRGDEILTEDSACGSGFLAGVCRAWEEACAPASRRGIRAVNLRFGVVLSARGGALARMLVPFRLGLGGVVGSGRQFLPWIELSDAAGVVLFSIVSDSLSGPVNAVAPQAVTNREFTRALGHALRRPTVFPLPAAVARLAFGEMADELLLASARAEPRKLLASGYAFRRPEIGAALRALVA